MHILAPLSLGNRASDPLLFIYLVGFHENVQCSMFSTVYYICIYLASNTIVNKGVTWLSAVTFKREGKT